ncbi:MAG: hypothetical protein M5U28_20460 [Sandaracinaceae bacterium]|nr:hypothetical protein [Sandaracinaceae bacterium]
MRRLLACTFLASAAALTCAASGAPRPASAAPRAVERAGRPAAAPACDGPRGRARNRERSRSIGYAWRGRLENGVLLRESSLVRYAGEYREGGNFYGTSQLVQLLERAAARVHQRLPGARLSVGELSAERGGSLPATARTRAGATSTSPST